MGIRRVISPSGRQRASPSECEGEREITSEANSPIGEGGTPPAQCGAGSTQRLTVLGSGSASDTPRFELDSQTGRHRLPCDSYLPRQGTEPRGSQTS